MKSGLFRKGIVLGIILLFVGTGVIPSTVGINKEKTTIMDSIDREICSIITSDGCVPDLECNGSLHWSNMIPGRTVTGYFTVENNGDPISLLDWEVIDYPDWGLDWTFTPASGTGLTPEDDPVTVGVSLVAPSDPSTEITGEVKVINSDNPDDYCEIDVYLETSRSIILYNTSLLRLFECSPLLEKLLSFLLL